LFFVEIELRQKLKSAGDDNVFSLLHGTLGGENPALAGAIVQPCENAVFGGLVKERPEQGQAPQQASKGPFRFQRVLLGSGWQNNYKFFFLATSH
jgi:hypothetical protein